MTPPLRRLSASDLPTGYATSTAQSIRLTQTQEPAVLNSHLSRRRFLQTGAAVVAASGLPLRAQAVAANSKLRTAHIGVGGMGWSDLNSIASHPGVEIAALCDVDSEMLARASKAFPSAKGVADFRSLLSDMGDSIDAVVVSTPDHTHAAAAMTALNAGKPVYCQKPLTHDIFEARRLAEAASAAGAPTQMGIQIHSVGVYRQAREILRSGAIGRVHRVDAWCDKGWGYNGDAPSNHQAPPATLDWNLWLGTAEHHEYVPKVYHPGQWRKFLDFGTGTLGDMGAHILDTPYAALDLGAPTSVRATCRQPNGVGHPLNVRVEWEFPGTSRTTNTLPVVWHDGDLAPPKLDNADLPAGLTLPPSGSLVSGEQGSLLVPHFATPQLFPKERSADYKAPDAENGNHYHEWVDACRGDATPSADFAYGGALTETLLVGVIATRFPGETLQWNAKPMRFSNAEEPNAFVRRTYRDGFQVTGLSEV